jgi:hypothetical protein
MDGTCSSRPPGFCFNFRERNSRKKEKSFKFVGLLRCTTDEDEDEAAYHGGGEGRVVEEEVVDAPTGADVGEVVGDHGAVSVVVVVAAALKNSRVPVTVSGGRVHRRVLRAIIIGVRVAVGELGADEEEAGVLGGEVVGAVDGLVAVGAQDGAVLHAEHQPPALLKQNTVYIMSAASSATPVELRLRQASHLAHVAERPRGAAGVGVEEWDAAVLAGELVGAVDASIAGGAERGLVSAAEHRSRLAAAHVAVHAHGAQPGERSGDAFTCTS